MINILKTLALIILFTLVSCSNLNYYPRTKFQNNEIKNRPVKLKMKNGTIKHAYLYKITLDSIYTKNGIIPSASVQKIGLYESAPGKTFVVTYVSVVLVVSTLLIILLGTFFFPF